MKEAWDRRMTKPGAVEKLINRRTLHVIAGLAIIVLIGSLFEPIDDGAPSLTERGLVFDIGLALALMTFAYNHGTCFWNKKAAK